MKTTIKLLCIWVLIFLAGCDVKDPIYNTDHPENGKVTLATDWSARTAGIDIPASYTVTVGEYSATVSNAGKSSVSCPLKPSDSAPLC